MDSSFLSGSLRIPVSRKIPNTVTKIQFFLVEDETLPLKLNLMRPYPRKDLDYSKRVYNYRISRARRTVDYAFGMLTKKFGVLQTSMETSAEVSEAFVKSFCVLHNFIKRENNFNYFPSDDVHKATQSYNSKTCLTATRSPSASDMKQPSAVRIALTQYVDLEQSFDK